MQGLKAIVVGLGIAIVLSMGALAYGLYYKSQHPDFKLFASSPTAERPHEADGPPAAPADGALPFGALLAPLPAGCGLAEMRPQGGRLYLRGDCGVVAVVDVAAGRLLGTVDTRAK
ncbi:MAG: hypothetical protein H7841_10555 [Magnetospirillum sp. WYHS-4]